MAGGEIASVKVVRPDEINIGFGFAVDGDYGNAARNEVAEIIVVCKIVARNDDDSVDPLFQKAAQQGGVLLLSSIEGGAGDYHVVALIEQFLDFRFNFLEKRIGMVTDDADQPGASSLESADQTVFVITEPFRRFVNPFAGGFGNFPLAPHDSRDGGQRIACRFCNVLQTRQNLRTHECHCSFFLIPFWGLQVLPQLLPQVLALIIIRNFEFVNTGKNFFWKKE